MRYAHFAEICKKCVNMQNMRRSHIRIKLACLVCECLCVCDVGQAYGWWTSEESQRPKSAHVQYVARGPMMVNTLLWPSTVESSPSATRSLCVTLSSC